MRVNLQHEFVAWLRGLCWYDWQFPYRYKTWNGWGWAASFGFGHIQIERKERS